MNGVYRSSHIRGLCVRILSEFNFCNTKLVNNISHIYYNILTKSIRHIKTIIDTYSSLLPDDTCSMLVVPKGLKQGVLRVSVCHFSIQ
jgi:hypothetical protein